MARNFVESRPRSKTERKLENKVQTPIIDVELYVIAEKGHSRNHSHLLTRHPRPLLPICIGRPILASLLRTGVLLEDGGTLPTLGTTSFWEYIGIRYQ